MLSCYKKRRNYLGSSASRHEVMFIQTNGVSFTHSNTAVKPNNFFWKNKPRKPSTTGILMQRRGQGYEHLKVQRMSETVHGLLLNVKNNVYKQMLLPTSTPNGDTPGPQSEAKGGPQRRVTVPSP